MSDLIDITESSALPWWRRLVERFGIFTAVGLSTFVLDIVLMLFFANQFELSTRWAVTLSFLIAVHINYLILRHHVYRGTHEGVEATYVKFLVVVIIVGSIMPHLVSMLAAETGWPLVVVRTLVGAGMGCFGFIFNTFFNFKYL